VGPENDLRVAVCVWLAQHVMFCTRRKIQVFVTCFPELLVRAQNQMNLSSLSCCSNLQDAGMFNISDL
jgi:hypothetical protein